MIYFIERDGGVVKIGTTIRLSQRLAQLTAEHGQKLTVLGVMAGSFVDERALHKQFAHWRMEGEWFMPNTSLSDFIRDHADAWDGVLDKAVRVELTEDVHRMLHKLAADEGTSIAAFTRKGVEKLVRDEFNRRGLK